MPLIVGLIVALATMEGPESVIWRSVARGVVISAVVSLWLGLSLGVFLGILIGFAVGIGGGISSGIATAGGLFPHGQLTQAEAAIFLGLMGTATGFLLHVSEGDFYPKEKSQVIELIKAIVKATVVLGSLSLMMLLANPLTALLELDFIMRTGIAIPKLGQTTILGLELYLPNAISYGLFSFVALGTCAAAITTWMIGWKIGKWRFACLYGIGAGLLFGLSGGFTEMIFQGMVSVKRTEPLANHLLVILLTFEGVRYGLMGALQFTACFAVPFILIRRRQQERQALLSSTFIACAPVLLGSGSTGLVVLVVFMTLSYIFTCYALRLTGTTLLGRA